MLTARNGGTVGTMCGGKAVALGVNVRQKRCEGMRVGAALRLRVSLDVASVAGT